MMMSRLEVMELAVEGRADEQKEEHKPSALS